MIAAVLLLLQSAPTLSDIARMPPAKAGETVLRDQDHQPIDSVETPAIGGLEPPGLRRLEFVERARKDGPGCTRRRWHARFQADGPDRAPILSGISSTSEIAALVAETCANSEYVHLNSGVEPARGFAALERLRQLRLNEKTPRFHCTDTTRSGLCASDESIIRELTRLSPWAISARNAATMLWLGTKGQVVTELTFDPATPDRVTIDRRIPAPA
ncbi:hypothetical protein ABC347_02535 [Sphingomonas sp. 1P06PA]|uniref:hypothetical protein n=1 Tax=Sphingomonas sp. 1P06PA TaxID=554121 RepID=UPI0039A541DE